MTRRATNCASLVAVLVLVLVLVAFTVSAPAAPKEYPVTGMVVRVDATARSFSASIQAIPNFMPAMTMPFEVTQAGELQGLAPGVIVAFSLVVDGNSSRAERIRIVQYQNSEQDPFSASRLKLLSDLAAGRGGPAVPTLSVGDVVPDFSLTDQRRRAVSLSQFRATAGFGLRVVIPAMGPVPLAFDFAFPIRTQTIDNERIFSFYVGINR